MKSVSRKRFLLCFRPVVDNDDGCLVLDSEDTGSRKKKFSHHQSNKRERKNVSQDEFDRKLLKSFSVGEIQEIKLNPILSSSSSSSSSHQSSLGLSCSSPTSYRSSSSESKISHHSNNDQERVVKLNEEHPHVVSSSSSSSSSSSCYHAMSLLLVTLAVTVLWGKVCAIFFTSIWFYFLRQQTNCRRPENVKENVIKDERVSKESHTIRGSRNKKGLL